jgi:P27 family predicted phage terminase small subunit
MTEAEATWKPPKGLAGIGRTTWRRIVRSARPAGLLTDLDLPLLAQFCHAVSDLSAMQQHRPRTIGSKDYREHMAMEHKTRTAVSTMARLLGLAPTTRGTVKPSSVPPPDDGDAEYFG